MSECGRAVRAGGAGAAGGEAAAAWDTADCCASAVLSACPVHDAGSKCLGACRTSSRMWPAPSTRGRCERVRERVRGCQKRSHAVWHETCVVLAPQRSLAAKSSDSTSEPTASARAAPHTPRGVRVVVAAAAAIGGGGPTPRTRNPETPDHRHHNMKAREAATVTPQNLSPTTRPSSIRHHVQKEIPMNLNTH